MTLLFFDGFDNPATMPKPEWDSFAMIGQLGRDGSTNGAASWNTASKVLTLPTPAATCIVGAAMRPTTTGVWGATGNPPLSFRTGALTTDSFCLNFDIGAHLQLRTGTGTGGVLATGTTTFTINTWSHLQVRATSSATALTVSVYLNGNTTPELTYTGASASSQTAAITKITLGSTANNAIWWDDLYVCDAVDATATQGRLNNDVLGDLKVVTVLPSGAGNDTQWTPSTGTNFGAVDENPPNQTDYVAAAATGQRDTYATAGVPVSTLDVYGLRVGAYAQKSDAGAASLKPLVREAGGSIDGTNTVALGVGWSPVYSNLITRKADNSLWTAADVNAAQVGIESA